MPELPEAETIVRGLRDALPGRTLRDARILHADVLADTVDAFRDAVKGRTVRGVERRGKNVVVSLDGEVRIVVNLGMTGALLPDPPADGPGAATHPAVVFELDRGRLVYDDVRRFGRLEAMDRQRFETWSEALGPEPLAPDFSAEDLGRILAGSRSPVRSRLLDQRRLAGVGNIYANEALWQARVHPARPCRELAEDDARRLHEALRAVLREAVEAGGTTIRDYRNADGDAGSFGRRLRAYGREGKPCARCDTPLRRIVFGNRSAYHCPSCQPGPSDDSADAAD